MDPLRLQLREDEAVLAYLESEQLPSWRGSPSPWIVEGYSLTTHPDLCDRVTDVNAAAGNEAEFGYLYGKPVLVAQNGVIVTFANGTHTFCVRLPVAECGRELVVTAEDDAKRYGVSSGSIHALVRKKRLQLDALTQRDWTRLDPYAIAVPRAEGLARLAAHLERALERATPQA